MNKLILTIGPSNCGKSYFASMYAKNNKDKEHVIVLNRDEIRLSIFGLSTLKEYRLHRINEKLVTEIQKSIADNSLIAYKNTPTPITIIVADTNLNRLSRRFWTEYAQNNNLELVLKHDWSSDEIIDLEILLERNRRRIKDGKPNPVPEYVILAQYERYLEYIDSL